MGQAKQTCPRCQRPPGGVHRARCPRSNATLGAVNNALEAAGRPRPIWLFGPQTVTVDGRRQHTDNPGIPFVNTVKYPNKAWYAGSIPDRARAQIEEMMR